MATLQTLNELIDDSAARSEELAGHVKLATNQVNNLVDQAFAQLRNTLTATGQDAQAQFASLTNILDATEQALSDEIQSAMSAYADLRDKATEVDNKLDTVAEEIDQHLQDLQQQVETLAEAISQEAGQINTAMADLEEESNTTRSDAENLSTSTEDDLEQFQTSIETVQDDLNQRKDDLLEQFQTLQSMIQDKLETVTGDFDNLQEMGRDRTDELVTALDGHDQHCSDLITQLLPGEACDVINTAGDGLTQALSVLNEVSETSQELLDGKVGDVLDTINDILDVVEPVMDVLEKVQDILG